MNDTYIVVADTAKAVRAALKDAFPGGRFRVRTSPGGGAVNVSYVDGPGEDAVKDAIGKVVVAGKAFDGMIDLAYSIYSYLDKDGKVVGTKSSGAYPSTPGWDDAPATAVRTVFFSAYVFVTRDLSPDVAAKRDAWIRKAWDVPDAWMAGPGAFRSAADALGLNDLPFGPLPTY